MSILEVEVLVLPGKVGSGTDPSPRERVLARVKLLWGRSRRKDPEEKCDGAPAYLLEEHCRD